MSYFFSVVFLARFDLFAFSYIPRVLKRFPECGSNNFLSSIIVCKVVMWHRLFSCSHS